MEELGQQTRRLRTKGRRGKLSRCIRPSWSNIQSYSSSLDPPSQQQPGTLVLWETQRSESSERLGQLLDRRGAAAWYRGILEHIPLAQWQSAAGVPVRLKHGGCKVCITVRHAVPTYLFFCVSVCVCVFSLCILAPLPALNYCHASANSDASVLCCFPTVTTIPLANSGILVVASSHTSVLPHGSI